MLGEVAFILLHLVLDLLLLFVVALLQFSVEPHQVLQLYGLADIFDVFV